MGIVVVGKAVAVAARETGSGFGLIIPGRLHPTVIERTKKTNANKHRLIMYRLQSGLHFTSNPAGGNPADTILSIC